MPIRCLPGQEARSFQIGNLERNGAPPSTRRRRPRFQEPLPFYLLILSFMNKVIDSMLAEISPEMQGHALNLITADLRRSETHKSNGFNHLRQRFEGCSR
jgi:hypothetical protein